MKRNKKTSYVPCAATKSAVRQENRFLAVAAVLAVCLASGSPAAKAQLYDVNCGEYSTDATMTGPAILGATGDQWYAYNAGNYTWGPQNTVTITDSTGSSAAGVTLDIWNYITGSINSGGTTANPSPLMEDYIAAASAGDGWPIKVQLNNLPASASYQLVVYSSGDTAGQGGTINLTDSTFANISATATTTGTDRDITQSEGDAYQILNGTTDSSGNIYFDVLSTTGWHALNGFQLELESVPEPSSMALGAGGIALLTLFRRRFSR
jgi:hypothetical protein